MKNKEINIVEIEKLLITEENYIFRIPPYQRNYSWNKQTITLLDDIDNSELDYSLFVGVIFCYIKSNEIIIVDGQQRIVTFFIILNRLLNRIK